MWEKCCLSWKNDKILLSNYTRHVDTCCKKWDESVNTIDKYFNKACTPHVVTANSLQSVSVPMHQYHDQVGNSPGVQQSCTIVSSARSVLLPNDSLISQVGNSPGVQHSCTIVSSSAQSVLLPKDSFINQAGNSPGVQHSCTIVSSAQSVLLP